MITFINSFKTYKIIVLVMDRYICDKGIKHPWE